MANVTKINATPKPASLQEAETRPQRVAAYARVSTDHEDQQSSLMAQTDYYVKFITSHEGWEFAGIFADDGISGTSTRRPQFTKMLEACEEGRIDLILTKSISRFARNTVDSITVIRHLKEKGIGIYFEKESIFTLDSKGEFLLTIMSSIAQEESRSISENVAWGQRKRFADGKCSIAYSSFLGYDKGPEKYQMVVNPEQAVIVKRIYYLYLCGYSCNHISDMLQAEGTTTPSGRGTWTQGSVRSILTNEKYKGDALLQKQFTKDFLSKKCVKNEGQLPQYYIEGDHEAIVSPALFDYVQKELKRRSKDENAFVGLIPFSNKLVCAKCGAKYGTRLFHSNDKYRKIVWMCGNRYKHGRDKSKRCETVSLNDTGVYKAIYGFARDELFRRRVDTQVLKILKDIIPKKRHAGLSAAIRSFKKMPAENLARADEDMGIFIRELLIYPDETVQITLIDGTHRKIELEPDMVIRRNRRGR